MATHGNIGEFHADSKNWASYIEQLQQYLIANNIKDVGRQRAVLLNIHDTSMYQLIRKVVSPAKLTKSEKIIFQTVSDNAMIYN